MKVKRGKAKREKVKKMLENKIRKLVVALAGVFLVVAMTGAVSAISSMEKSPNELTLHAGETGTFTVIATAEYTTSGYFGVDINPKTANLGVVIRDSGGQLASGTGASTVSSNAVSYNAGSTTTLYVEITNNGAVERDYSAKFTAYDGNQDFTEAIIKAKVTAIPEFATLAIPMAIAILGGLFFLNHRKRREE